MSYDEFMRILRLCDISETDDIKPESRLREDLALSSFQMMVLLVELEKALQMEIDPVTLTDSSTVAELLSSLEKLKVSF